MTDRVVPDLPRPTSTPRSPRGDPCERCGGADDRLPAAAPGADAALGHRVGFLIDLDGTQLQLIENAG